MTPVDLGRDLVAVVGGLIAAAVVFRRLPWAARLRLMRQVVEKSVHVAASPVISEHWKRRVLPHYAALLLTSAVWLAGWLWLLVFAFGTTFVAVRLVLAADVALAFERLLAPDTHLLVLALGLGGWVLLRQPPEQPDNEGCSTAGKMFYEIASMPLVRRRSFDLDARFAPRARHSVDRPVYVLGLARSGATMLLEALYSSGDFTTLTDRDMPFPLAPGLWRRLARPFRRNDQPRERPHGDGVLVNWASPGDFDEVFWLTFCREDYVARNGLRPHVAADDVVDAYRRYVVRLVALERGRRYLAGGANHLLRISSIRRAFGDAILLVPFRHPVDHAASLLNQHQRFLDIHARDRFSLRYMTSLGQFDAGASYRPFLVPERSQRVEIASMEYWLDYWRIVHEYLLDTHGAEVSFVDFDALVDAPGAGWAAVATAVGVAPGRIGAYTDRDRTGRDRTDRDRTDRDQSVARSRSDAVVSQDVMSVYERLKSAAVNVRPQ